MQRPRNKEDIRPVSEQRVSKHVPTEREAHNSTVTMETGVSYVVRADLQKEDSFGNNCFLFNSTALYHEICKIGVICCAKPVLTSSLLCV
jgi:hypothetical protein